MKWSQTIASGCRYGDVAGRIFGDSEIIWDNSFSDYQARLPDGRFAHYAWDYGSCSGCDDWERRNLSDDEIEAEMRSRMAVLGGVDAMARYVTALGNYDRREFSCRSESKFISAADAFMNWLRANIQTEE